MKIDNFFAQKLRNYEKQPSDVAWSKLNARLASPQRRIVPLWSRYAMAASVLLLLVAGLWWKWSSLSYPTEFTAQTTKGIITKPSLETVQKPMPVLASSKESTPQKEANELINKKIQPDNVSLTSVLVPDHINQVADESVAPKIEKVTTENTAALTELTPKATLLENIQEKITEMPTAKTELVAQAEPKTPEQTFEITIEEPSQDATTETLQTERKRKFRLFGLLKQLKNAATGQKVDWNDAGVNPTRLFARADASLERGRDRIKKN